MTIIEKQYLNPSDVRIMCIENNLYTRGTDEQYEAMFSMVKDLYPKSIITAEDLYPIAADILSHSRTDTDVTYIMYCLAEKIIRTYDAID